MSYDKRRAGHGLRKADAKKKFGRRAELGAQGEEYAWSFYESAGLMDVYSAYSSLSIPSPSGRKRYSGDVDMVFVNGDRMVLVDIKVGRRNQWYWTIPFTDKPMVGMSPLVFDGKWGLSANMSLAVDRYRVAFPECKVSAITVYVPFKGYSPASVTWLVYPGGIRSMLLGSSVAFLKRRLGTPAEVPLKVRDRLRSLMRR